MLTQEIKKKIDSARDILVGKVPDPKAQVEQITTALIYKFMDDMDKESVSLPKGKARFFTNGYEKYAWNKLLDPKVGGQERLNLYDEAITRMSQNPHLPQLFREIFKDAFLPYRDSETLNLFLKEINGFAYDNSENLGDAYEYLLSILGSQGEAGQFRTPRHIIDFIVEVVDPKNDESILDPACGTAGFLISAYKHILNSHKDRPLTPDEKKRLMMNLVGYDISPDMVRISLVNMYLHGFPNPNICEYDTLTNEERWDDRFDVIMANPPFMTPKGGIRPHKRFAVQAKRSEVLFVDYIIEHLNIKGRAGLIVPEGIIFQSSNAYKQLRKKLLEDGLYAVVSLPAGVFKPYSGVKTGILFFDNDIAKRSKEILFVKVLNDGFDLGAQRKPIDRNDLTDAVNVLKAQQAVIQTSSKNTLLQEGSSFAWAVTKEKIAESGDYNLSGDRYNYSKILLNHKWATIGLGDEKIFKIESGGTPDSNNESFWNGEICWATLVDLPSENIITEIKDTERKITKEGLNNSSAKLLPENSILVSSRATLGRIAINRVKLATNQGFKNIIIKDFEKADPKFVAFMITGLIDQMINLASGGTFKEISKSNIAKLKIPLPPLEIQQQIVAEFDSYQKIIDGARQIAENYKPTIKIDPKWKKIELGDVCRVEYGYGETARKAGDVRYIRITDINKDGRINGDPKYINLTKEAQRYLLNKGDLVVARTGATYGKTLLFEGNEKAVFASFLMRLNFDETKVFPPFYWLFTRTQGYWSQAKALVTGGAQPQFNGNAIKKIMIPLPSISEQKEIYFKTAKEQNLILYNTELTNIFKQKIKDKIAEVWGE
jgi:type I restriction enzyme M protein